MVREAVELHAFRLKAMGSLHWCYLIARVFTCLFLCARAPICSMMATACRLPIRYPHVRAVERPTRGLNSVPTCGLQRQFRTRPNNFRLQRSHAVKVSATDDPLLAQVALRDDYDPVIFIFCLNAIFLSVVLNVLNYGLDRDENGEICVPQGGLKTMLSRSKEGLLDYFRKPLQRVLMTDDLRLALDELNEAKKNAFLMRGTVSAEDAAKQFHSARRKAIRAGLPEDSPLLSAQNPSDSD